MIARMDRSSHARLAGRAGGRAGGRVSEFPVRVTTTKPTPGRGEELSTNYPCPRYPCPQWRPFLSTSTVSTPPLPGKLLSRVPAYFRFLSPTQHTSERTQLKSGGNLLNVKKNCLLRPTSNQAL
ncbi:hypothetical protein E2C01_040390 [Portunus trituberculatus]|uniref:Uncharacterized protein n=1 Tax=Portunus trituberculatus TaxID=210409 RepID=A0A5B7FMJ4_PORTR|nr:hypothetical protein [Portunus trituberculatus]